VSADTKEALENALLAHIEDEYTGYKVSGYVLEVACMSMEEAGHTLYPCIVPDYQPMHATAGLVKLADAGLVEAFAGGYDEEADDDDD
jgi:hypothetical protein